MQVGAGDVLGIQLPRFRNSNQKSVSGAAGVCGNAISMAALTVMAVALRRVALPALLLALIFAPFAGAALGASSEATQTALTVAADNSGPRTMVTLTAHVGPLSGMNMPAGVVTFRAGASELGSAVLDANGDATLTTNNLPAGSHQVIAVYRGGADFKAPSHLRQRPLRRSPAWPALP